MRLSIEILMPRWNIFFDILHFPYVKCFAANGNFMKRDNSLKFPKIVCRVAGCAYSILRCKHRAWHPSSSLHIYKPNKLDTTL